MRIRGVGEGNNSGGDGTARSCTSMVFAIASVGIGAACIGGLGSDGADIVGR
jgi:hypothetical protein